MEQQPRQTRYPFICDIESVPLRLEGEETDDARILSGKVVDISEHGACVISNCSFEPLATLPWKFHLPNIPVPLTLLAQVRWIEPLPSDEDTCRIGLLFVV